MDFKAIISLRRFHTRPNFADVSGSELKSVVKIKTVEKQAGPHSLTSSMHLKSSQETVLLFLSGVSIQLEHPTTRSLRDFQSLLWGIVTPAKVT